MRYRRNADTQLRKMERDWIATGNRDLLIPINRERRRVGLPPHPDARVILANNGLYEWVPQFAQQVLTALEVYNEIDIPMHIHHLREMRAEIDEDYDIDALLGDEDEGTLVQAIMELTNEIRLLETQRRIVSRANIDFSLSGDFPDEYENLRQQRGVSTISLGEIPEIPEDEKGTLYFFSRQRRQQQARRGHAETREQINWMYQLVSRRALKIYRKLLTYGALPMNQVIEATPEMIAEWYDQELSDLDELADKIEIATNEILDVTQGFGPSPEAIELFSSSWYQDEED